MVYIKSGQFWSNLVKSGQIWSNLVKSGQNPARDGHCDAKMHTHRLVASRPLFISIANNIYSRGYNSGFKGFRCCQKSLISSSNE